MVDPFDKAEQWRSRASDLRAMAAGMRDARARAGLLEMADSMEHHADHIVQMAIRLRCSAPVFRAEATETVPEAAD